MTKQEIDDYVRVAQSLLAIRDNKLYEPQHATFGEYCKSRWGISEELVNDRLTAMAQFLSSMADVTDLHSKGSK